jgi:hypothetical protein
MAAPSDKLEHPACPHCGKRVKVRTMLDIAPSQLKQAMKDGDPEWFFGSAGMDRALMKECTKGKWVHVRIGKSHRIAYLRGARK